MTARNAWRALVGVGAPLFVLVACSGGNVARFAPCNAASDTCPSATTCEAPLTASPSTASQMLCTWTCNNDDFDAETCPNDSNGSPGECIADVGGIPVSSTGGGRGFCFQGCSDGSACPDGTMCVDADGIDPLSRTKVCFPIATDPLANTTWASNTLTLTAKSNGVVSSTYTLTFGPQTGYAQGAAQGSLTATLVQIYDTASFHPFASCTETTTYTGGTWNDTPPSTSQPGNLTLLNTTSSTDRTGCTSSSSNVSGEPDDYEISDGTAGYLFSGTTMNLGGEYGAVPYGDNVEWTFTKQ